MQATPFNLSPILLLSRPAVVHQGVRLTTQLKHLVRGLVDLEDESSGDENVALSRPTDFVAGLPRAWQLTYILRIVVSICVKLNSGSLSALYLIRL